MPGKGHVGEELTEAAAAAFEPSPQPVLVVKAKCSEAGRSEKVCAEAAAMAGLDCNCNKFQVFSQKDKEGWVPDLLGSIPAAAELCTKPAAAKKATDEAAEA